jgi:hypothetical protein
MMNLYYVGDRYYSQSKTVLGILYDDAGNRSDWGFVSAALRKGESVHIRPASGEEMRAMDKRLDEVLALPSARTSGAKHG